MKVPFRFLIDSSKLLALKYIALNRGVSVAELVRQAIDGILAKSPPDIVNIVNRAEKNGK